MWSGVTGESVTETPNKSYTDNSYSKIVCVCAV